MFIEGRKTETGGKCLLDMGDRYTVETWEADKLVKRESFPDYETAKAAYMA